MISNVSDMDLFDTSILFRSKILSFVTGVDNSFVLNSDESDIQTNIDAVSLSAEIRHVMNRISSFTIDTVNNRVDYSTISRSESYKKYRFLTNRLSYLDLNAIIMIPDKLAFWINMYNSLVIDAVIQFGIDRSVSQGVLGIFSFFDKAAYRIGSNRFSLSDIEHGILRSNKGLPYMLGANFSENDPRKDWILPHIDPRIHFALNCASRSCPPINFFDPDKIDLQLNIATLNFLNQNVSLDVDKRTISISSIFRLYKSDFGGREGIVEFLYKHSNDGELKNFIKNNWDSLRMKFQKYDWTINSV